jgi:hypothetical protein
MHDQLNEQKIYGRRQPRNEKEKSEMTTLYISTSALSGDGMAFSLRYYRDCAISSNTGHAYQGK